MVQVVERTVDAVKKKAGCSAAACKTVRMAVLSDQASTCSELVMLSCHGCIQLISHYIPPSSSIATRSMDPITALGIAAATAQFISFGLEALDLCRQIRDNANGATNANKQLEAHSRLISEILGEIRQDKPEFEKAGKRISHVAKDCLATSNELTILLRDVRGAGRSKPMGALHATLKALKSNRRIERLKIALREKQGQLDSAVVHDTRNRVDLLAIEQSKGFRDLSETAKQLFAQLQQLQDVTTSSSGRIDTQLAVIQAQSSRIESQGARIESQGNRIESAIATASGSNLTSITSLDTKIDQRFNNLDLNNARERLLDSLYDAELNMRQDTLVGKPPWHQTFDWAFEGPASFKATFDEPEIPRWENLSEWLESNHPLYWICGKPASGKSTLMAYLAHEPRTDVLLNTWAAENRLFVLRFFFWKPGTRLQKSIEGLLRSLLYQLLELIPELVQLTLSTFQLELSRLPNWPEWLLRKMASCSFSSEVAKRYRFFLFIDGLDEFEGDSDELLHFISDLQQHSWVKCCVSSRPEIKLQNHFVAAGAASLRLEDLNRQDIKLYVLERLQGRNIEDELIDDVWRRAHGVFLWAVLVTTDVIRGCDAEDDAPVLRSRLDTTPCELNEIFARMLAAIDAVPAQSVAFVFKAMHLMRERSLNLAETTAACRPHLKYQMANYDEFIDECRRTERQIIAQTRGLVEFRSVYTFRSSEREVDPYLSVWMVPQKDLDRLHKINLDSAEGRRDLVFQRGRAPASSMSGLYLSLKAELQNGFTDQRMTSCFHTNRPELRSS